MSSVFEMWFYVGFKSYLGFFFPRILRHERQKGFWSTVIIIFFLPPQLLLFFIQVLFFFIFIFFLLGIFTFNLIIIV